MIYDTKELLAAIDPALLDYQQWVNVGMALKEDGGSVYDWDTWSSRDTRRYHSDECEKKWRSFAGGSGGQPVTMGTIVQYAREQGWRPATEGPGYELDWDSQIGGRRQDGVVVDDWLENADLPAVSRRWNPVRELTTYLETLFEAGETVGYVTASYEKDGRWVPASKGAYDRTAGELIKLLGECKGDIGAVIGDTKPDAGAWIRFNPLDGKGVKNDNVTEYRYALVESDTQEIEKQYAILQKLELPIAILVHSGGKSLHAIVKINAADYNEYRKRVNYLYDICAKNELVIDTQNRNPSRLSRMPGVMRKGNKQYIVAKNIGKESFEGWQEWIESVNDDLPEPENIGSLWEHMPELAPVLIEGILRMGHKLLLAGPSKAGKSFSLIALCCAIAEGMKWLGWQCAQGPVLYVNLELDRASCLRRFKEQYAALGYEPKNIKNIDVWNLRGKSMPMDLLAPKLIRRAAKKGYIAIVIDPIYKVITGDENSADQMAKFCNQFDMVCTQLECAVIYCHHHSKGQQGQKRSMDRASGSGVFARDPDAMLDMIELDVTDALRKAEGDRAVCAAYEHGLLEISDEWSGEYTQDDLCSPAAMRDIAHRLLTPPQEAAVQARVDAARAKAEGRTAWRIEGTLREFAPFKPRHMWFDYPVHRADDTGVLGDLAADGEEPPYRKNFNKKKSKEESKKDRCEAINNAFEYCTFDGDVTIKALVEYTKANEKTVRRHLKEHGGFWIDGGKVGRK